MRLIRDETDDEGNITNTVDDKDPETDVDQVAEPSGEYTEQEGGSLPPDLTDPDEIDAALASPRMFYVDGCLSFRGARPSTSTTRPTAD
jgi:type I restriction enzyme, R subunit